MAVLDKLSKLVKLKAKVTAFNSYNNERKTIKITPTLFPIFFCVYFGDLSFDRLTEFVGLQVA